MHLHFDQPHDQPLLGGDRCVGRSPVAKHAIEVGLTAGTFLGRHLLLIVRPTSRTLVEVGACLCHARRFHSRGNVADLRDVRALAGSYFGLQGAVSIGQQIVRTGQ